MMSVPDADVIKTYAEINMSIGIIASMAFNPAKDTDLHLLKCEHLFGAHTTYIALRRAALSAHASSNCACRNSPRLAYAQN